MTLNAETNGTHKTRSHYETTEIRLALTNAEGVNYEGRFEGRRLVEDVGYAEVYQTEAGNVVLYEAATTTLTVMENPEEDLRGVLCNGAYVEAMAALRIRATVDLDI